MERQVQIIDSEEKQGKLFTSGDGTGVIKTKNSLKSPNSTKIFEFLIVLNLPKWIDKYAKQLKSDFHDRFGSYYSRHSKPHITISKFPYLEKNQERFLRLLQGYLFSIDSIRIELNGFESFKGSNNRVISIHVEESDDLNKLKDTFHNFRDRLGYNSTNFFIFKNPHVTIARGLRKEVFEKAKDVYLPARYWSSFVVDKLKVLRREVNDDGTYGRYEDICDLMLGSHGELS